VRLRVNPIACTGHGVCAELLPERIGIDEWGYPLVSAEPVPAGLERLARRAVADCPRLALLADAEETQRYRRAGTRRSER
jgi:ferredoxin